MKKIYELKNQRQTLLDEASAALDADNTDIYNSKMAEVKALNAKIQALEDLENEGGRFSESRKNPAPSLADQGLTDRNDGEYMNAFFYALTNGISPKNGKGNEKLAPLYNALTESGGTPEGSDGGFLVPVEFNNMINEQRRQLIKLSDYFGLENVTASKGWRATDKAPTTGFELVDEMGTIPTDNQPKFGKVTYSLSKYALRVPVSNELLSDNTANLMAYLARWFAKKGIITENILLKSLLDSLSASNLTVGKEIKDIKTAINKGLDPDIALNAVVLTNQSGFDHLDQMEDLNGRPLLQPDPTTGTPMMFKSKPVIMVSDAMLPNRVVTATGATKGDYYPVYIGDFKSFGTLFRRNLLEVDSTDIGGNAWATASNEVRGIVRLDAQKIDEGAAIKREIFVTAN